MKGVQISKSRTVRM